jgi:hypothetical protein
MFELTNEQRKCFALVPVSDQWERIEVKPSPYDQFKTYIYLDGDTIVKCILCGDAQYCEYELAETVSPDKKYLMPKTAKGKPVLLSSSNILKRKSIGMVLSYKGNCIRLWGDRGDYYSNSYLQDEFRDLSGFSRWVEDWCAETSDADREDVFHFSQQKRLHIRYREGDVFRFKIGRRLYGYGRILLDYDKMRKGKEPFWDILMSKPVVCSVYHVFTQRKDLSIEELKLRKSLPSCIVADNGLFYGEYEIIGNLPITEQEDYPIMYGNSIAMGEKAVCYQCGKVFRKIENRSEPSNAFINNGVSFSLNFNVDVLQRCIIEDSNVPYWEMYYQWATERDLRNPKHTEKLKLIRKKMGLE